MLQEDLPAWKVYYRILFLFLLSRMLPWMNKFLITENIFLPRLIQQESCRSSHCIFQSISALNTRSKKIPQGSFVKVCYYLLNNNLLQYIDWLLTYV